MMETSITMLERLRRGVDTSAWERLVELYTPLIRSWLGRHSLINQDVEDLVQEVLAVVVRKLPGFQRQPRTGAFRHWLRSISANCLREFWRANRLQFRGTGNHDFGQLLAQLEDPNSELSQLWDREHDEHITRRLLEMIRPRFEARTWEAFQRVALEGASVDQVARDLGLSVNAVFIAKSRVVRLLRQEGRGLIE